MTTIYLYGGEGKYTGAEEKLWHSPDLGSTHKFICFIAQNLDASQEDNAKREIAKLGFTERVGEGKPIHVEALNQPQMQDFQKHYEGALEEGFSLVWYPQSVSQEDANPSNCLQFNPRYCKRVGFREVGLTNTRWTGRAHAVRKAVHAGKRPEHG